MCHDFTERIYRIINFNNSFQIHWSFQLDWCIIHFCSFHLFSNYMILQNGWFFHWISRFSINFLQAVPSGTACIFTGLFYSPFFFYPSRRLGISSPREAWCISSASLGLYLITRQRVFSCGLMIYNTLCWWYAIPTELMIYKDSPWLHWKIMV